MSTPQPITTDPLNNPDHSLMHRQIAADTAAAAKSIEVGADSIMSILAGIKFPATQVPSADANTLDDYEEGAFTPDLQFGGAKVDITYDVQYGRYTKIGNRVFFSCYVALTSKGSSTGDAVVWALPFTASDVTLPACSVHFSNAITFANTYGGYVEHTLAAVSLDEITEAGARTTLKDTDFANNSTFMISGHYTI